MGVSAIILLYIPKPPQSASFSWN